MNFFKKIFRQKQTIKQVYNVLSDTRSIEQIQEDTEKLWALLRETVEYYNSLACPCAFPRFSQYTSIDCAETRNSFYMSETEGFIKASDHCFNEKEIDKGDDCYKAQCTCKTCGSTYTKAWTDFSISVNRTYLKPLEIKTKQIGADVEMPIPFFVGLFGHSYPKSINSRHVHYDIFRCYIQALRNGT